MRVGEEVKHEINDAITTPRLHRVLDMSFGWVSAEIYPALEVPG
jgi:hypothetical protein